MSHKAPLAMQRDIDMESTINSQDELKRPSTIGASVAGSKILFLHELNS